MDNTSVKRNRSKKNPPGRWCGTWKEYYSEWRCDQNKQLESHVIRSLKRTWKFFCSLFTSFTPLPQTATTTNCVMRMTGTTRTMGTTKMMGTTRTTRSTRMTGCVFFFYVFLFYLQDRLPRQHQGLAACKVQQQQAWPPSPRPRHHLAHMTTTPLGK